LRRLQLTIDSDLVHVALMAMAVNKVCSHFGMDEVAAYQVELCVSEAATNAILHAYRGQSGHQVSLVLKIDENRLDLEFSDTGISMRAEQVERVSHGYRQQDVSTVEAEALAEGGRGLHIMREIMDEVSYARQGDFNILRLTKHFRAAHLALPPS
jgi:serine/threonine-protein kinase RsbW